MKRIFEVTLGKMVTSSDNAELRQTRPYLRSANVQDGYLLLDDVKSMWFSESESDSLTLLKGDLVVCEGGDVGRSTVLAHDLPEFGFQNSVNRVRARKGLGASTSFLRYWLNSLKNNGLIDVICNRATIAHYTADKLSSTLMPFPPTCEQHTIATFLDYETSKTDDLVAQQDRLISLLYEKRQAAICYAVTKGFHADALMRPSGLEWLGEIPEYWDVVPLRAIFRFVKRQLGQLDEVLSVYREYGVIAKSSRNDNINKTPEDLSSYQTVYPGDLVVNKMKSWQGSLGVSKLKGITSPDYAVFEPIGILRSDYMNWLLRCKLLPDVYRSVSNGIRPDQWRLEPDKFKELKVPFPPEAEQADISCYLDKLVSGYADLTAECERAISLLKERRSSLISAAVTGKIDVRGLVGTSTPVQAAAA